MKKIVTIIGTRPQFIKASIVSEEIKKESSLNEIILHTGQHYNDNMSKLFFEELNIPNPKYNFNMIDKSYGKQIGKMMIYIEEILCIEKPDLVLLYGDTNSTLAGALISSQLNIPIAHIEAGLRSYNIRMLEEINRIVTDKLSTLLFVPTSLAFNNLKTEKINKNVFNVGDVMYDIALKYTNKANQISKILTELNIKSKDYILATIHRAENVDNKNKLFNIFTILNSLAKEFKIIMPIHPRTSKMIYNFNYTSLLSNILIIEPVGIFDMISLENNSKLIITDSGGIQKEAYFHKVPCVTLREETEWIETVECGCNKVVNPNDIEQVINNIYKMLSTTINDYQLKNYTYVNELYGNGDASKKIVKHIIEYFNSN
jgi:UDP-GlcNAc3NAcA epimerase